MVAIATPTRHQQRLVQGSDGVRMLCCDHCRLTPYTVQTMQNGTYYTVGFFPFYADAEVVYDAAIRARRR
jgi:hypothetical protein